MPALPLVLRLSLAGLLAATFAPQASASPCTAPASYVKAAEAERAPLVRPFVVGGLAAVALLQRGSERWVELAAPGVETAQRALAGAPGVQPAPRLLGASAGAVLLACSSLGPGVPATDARMAQQGGALATPLW